MVNPKPNKRLRSRYHTVEADYTDGHKASRGLSATTELLVLFSYCTTLSTASPTVEAVARSGELVYHVTIVSEGNAPRRLFLRNISPVVYL